MDKCTDKGVENKRGKLRVMSPQSGPLLCTFESPSSYCQTEAAPLRDLHNISFFRAEADDVSSHVHSIRAFRLVAVRRLGLAMVPDVAGGPITPLHDEVVTPVEGQRQLEDFEGIMGPPREHERTVQQKMR